ncbi:hypothetical protein [Cupriavidus sp.]|uniref:hypothetical protein n=1 Tax=Cupriavidus sp. TaxID=1873897 RepID=UPI003D0A30F0
MGDTRTKAAELFDLYAKHQKELYDYFMQCQLVAGALARGLREYVGLPEHFATVDGGHEDWVRLYNAIPLDGAPVKANSAFDLNKMNERGELQFAIALALAHGENSLSKRYFYVYANVRITAQSVLVTMGPDSDNVLEFEKGTPDFTPFYELFVEQIKEALSRSVYDQGAGAFAPKRKVGFL